MDTMKDTTMQHVTDVTIVPEATAEFIAGLLARIEQLEADLATAEQDSRQKQARIDRLEGEESKQAALLDCLNEWKELAKSAEKKCDALNAEMEARALQEPVAWMSSRNGFIVKDNKNHDYNMPLYLAPGAQPAPSAEMGWQEPVAEWLPLDSGEDTRRD